MIRSQPVTWVLGRVDHRIGFKNTDLYKRMERELVGLLWLSFGLISGVVKYNIQKLN